MTDLIYTKEEYRKDEDGFDEKYVYVPALDEWMSEEEFAFQKTCYDSAMRDARIYEQEHGMDDIIEYEEEHSWGCEAEDTDNDEDYSNMTREEAEEAYLRNGINYSEIDLNDWEDINRRLGFDFYKPKR